MGRSAKILHSLTEGSVDRVSCHLIHSADVRASSVRERSRILISGDSGQLYIVIASMLSFRGRAVHRTGERREKIGGRVFGT